MHMWSRDQVSASGRPCSAARHFAAVAGCDVACLYRSMRGLTVIAGMLCTGDHGGFLLLNLKSGTKLTELQKMKSEEMSPQCPLAAKTLLESKAGDLGSLQKPSTSGKVGRVMEQPRSSAATNGTLASRAESGDSTGAGSRRRRLWRVLKAALPVQVALVLLYCVACLLEPHCCDLLNNFHSPFGPQLRLLSKFREDLEN
ncbi:hypothetical protein HPB51_011145 [Rhipicephalus microplus]|uniref:KASH domain-containing protein n=1 Tax=Rhipicephalus microplus TaxID=6941 RepID=A0A9J6E0C1_RHIMP|nr:hypothetical protein HPB51_011145 [Rhipicephalus microplus]